MAFQFTNFAESTLASGISAAATSLTVASSDGALFPSSGDFQLVLVRNSDGAREIVTCTSRSSDVLTITRAQESTTGLILVTGDKVELRITAAVLATFIGVATDNTWTGDQTFSGDIMGASPFSFQGATDNAHTNTFTFVDPTGSRTTTFPDADVDLTNVVGLIQPKPFVWKCHLTPAGSSADMPIGAGQVMDSTGVQMFNIAALTKDTSGTWVVGDNQPGLDTGSIASSTTYHFYAIYRSDTGVSDYLFSLSASSPTMPASYDYFKRIGSWRTDGSSQWYKGYSRGNRFYLDALVTDVTQGNPGNSAATKTLTSVPTGIVARWIGIINFSANSNRPYLLLSSLAVSDDTPAAAFAHVTGAPQTSFTIHTSQHSPEIELNTSAQLRARCDGADGNTTYNLTTRGWVDEQRND